LQSGSKCSNPPFSCLSFDELLLFFLRVTVCCTGSYCNGATQNKSGCDDQKREAQGDDVSHLMMAMRFMFWSSRMVRSGGGWITPLAASARLFPLGGLSKPVLD
jgi:hypothetical protein